MRVLHLGKLYAGLAFAAAFAAMTPSRVEAAQDLSVDQVILRAVSRAQQAQAKSDQTAFTYTKMSVTEELDSLGKVKDRKEKVYQVVFQNGSTFLRLIEVNGKPAAQADLKKHSENEMGVRQLLGKPKGAAGDNRENFLTPELVARFDFKLIARSAINGRDAYQIVFQPKNPEPPVHHLVDRLLNRISGTLWIDADEFEVARADIQLGSEVTLLGGVAGTLKKLAYTMTRTRVADGVWLNTFSSGDFEGRKLIDSLRIKIRSESTNFKKLGINS